MSPPPPHARGFSPSEGAELPFISSFHDFVERQFSDPAGPEGIMGPIPQFHLKWPEATHLALLVPTVGPSFNQSLGKGFSQVFSNYDDLDVQRTAGLMQFLQEVPTVPKKLLSAESKCRLQFGQTFSLDTLVFKTSSRTTCPLPSLLLLLSFSLSTPGLKLS